jgi:creatinine amidohydrolase
MSNYYMTADEIIQSGADTVILPIGSTEQHGAHLPIATDSIIAEAISNEISMRMNLFMVPVLSYSTCYEHRGKKSSIWMKPETFYCVIRDIVLNLKDQGFKKIIILLGHGGIFISGPVIRELNALYPEITILKVDLLQFLDNSKMKEILKGRNNLHACEYETSLMLYLKEELVKKENIRDYIPEVPREYLNYLSLLKFSPSGVWGEPSLATKEKGEEIFELLVEESIKYINNTFQIINNYK